MEIYVLTAYIKTINEVNSNMWLTKASLIDEVVVVITYVLNPTPKYIEDNIEELMGCILGSEYAFFEEIENACESDEEV